MKTFVAVPTLLILLGTGAGSVMAQDIPDHIPDDPEESLADREKERMVERYRGTLSRLYFTGGFGVAPVTAIGLGYETRLGIGFRVPKGDALHASVGVRAFPNHSADPTRTGFGFGHVYVGAGYEVNGSRFLGGSETAHRAALEVRVGALFGDVSALALDLTPSYAVLARDGWSVPVGVRFSVAAFNDHDVGVARTFVALDIGVRWQVVRRERVK